MKKKIEETPEEENRYYMVKQAIADLNTTFIKAFEFRLEAEFEGKVVSFYDQHGELIACVRDWLEIRKVDRIVVDKIISESRKKNISVNHDSDEPKKETSSESKCSLSDVLLPKGFGDMK